MDLGMEIFFKRKQNALKIKNMIIKLDYTNIKNFCFSKYTIKLVQWTLYCVTQIPLQ